MNNLYILFMRKIITNVLKDLFRFVTRYRFFIMLLLIITGSVIYYFNQPVIKVVKGVNIKVCKSEAVDSIWDINDSLVSPVMYQKVPDLRDLHYKERMVKFVDLMLPSVLLAKEKMENKRKKLVHLQYEMENGSGQNVDSIYIEGVLKEYKTDDIREVIKRLHPHPTSIVLAQAAIESGWCTSRFCREANNIFGIWSYNSNEKRIRASESRNGNSVYLRKYDSLFESIYDYLNTIAKVHAYKEFREIRQSSRNPYRLIWYLSNYSEKRYEYVRTLRNVIEFNDLAKYDGYSLAKIKPDDPVWESIIE
ncbi:hypothetical protein E9993_19290 [Labilibacter sediminis]|nr:hypothetical protein E9993_19290 [Labilibacter sediminis]